jgi:hypothetical protein
MKNLLLISVILLTGLLSSCLKDSLSKGTKGSQVLLPVTPGSLAGSWQVINDTSTTQPWGIWAGQPVTGSNYVGVPTDYYKFTAGGNVYTNVAGEIDSATYTVSHDTVHVVYTYLDHQEMTGGIYNSFWEVTNLTAHTATITANFITPETALTSVTYLKK